MNGCCTPTVRAARGPALRGKGRPESGCCEWLRIVRGQQEGPRGKIRETFIVCAGFRDGGISYSIISRCLDSKGGACGMRLVGFAIVVPRGDGGCLPLSHSSDSVTKERLIKGSSARYRLLVFNSCSFYRFFTKGWKPPRNHSNGGASTFPRPPHQGLCTYELRLN